MLAAAGCDVTVVPATTSAADTLALEPDGVFLSNGPGDPEPCTYAVEASRRAHGARACRSSASASATRSWAWPAAAKTFKLKFGHRGANHPVKNLRTGQVEVTSQNHGFSVDPEAVRRGPELS